MDIQAEKIALIKLLLETNDTRIIESVKKIFRSEKKDFWNELSEEQKVNIELGEQQIERGECSDFEEFIQKYV